MLVWCMRYTPSPSTGEPLCQPLWARKFDTVTPGLCSLALLALRFTIGLWLCGCRYDKTRHAAVKATLQALNVFPWMRKSALLKSLACFTSLATTAAPSGDAESVVGGTVGSSPRYFIAAGACCTSAKLCKSMDCCSATVVLSDWRVGGR